MRIFWELVETCPELRALVGNEGNELTAVPDQPLYHHYLPAFYQSRWSGADGRLRRFSKPYGNRLTTKWVSPKVSGGEDLLYTDHSVAPEGAQVMESDFLSPLDSQASEALIALETDDPIIRTDPRLRSAWSRFLMSLMMRMPDHLETLTKGLVEEWARQMLELEAAYQAKKAPDDPATFAGYSDKQSPDELRSWMLSVLRTLMDHVLIGEKINNMRWFVRTIDGPAKFLTSDRPLITCYEFAARDSYIILPIGPSSAFVAVNNEETQRRIEACAAEQWVDNLNKSIAGAARKFVFAEDDSMKSFIAEHFGEKPRTTLFEYLTSFRRKRNAESGLSVTG